MKNSSFVMQAHPEYIESLYKQYLQDPNAVDSDWQAFFQGYDLGNREVSLGQSSQIHKEIKVLNLINDYRKRGHFFTETNPVRERRKYLPSLGIESFGLTKEDLSNKFEAGSEIGIGPATLENIIAHLNQTYCSSIGAEYMFVRRPERIKWLQEKMESSKNTPKFSLADKKHILTKLTNAVAFENFLHTKYIGQKRFSLSGVESVIPGLDTIIEKGAELNIDEFVIGMAHRGRLNVLANIMQKSYYEMLAEFEGSAAQDAVFAGDVKYHMGYSSDVKTRCDKNVHLNLIPNPSHLEAVGPVTQGVVRAKIDRRYGGDAGKVVPILIHGDAAIAGQGIVYEVSQMSTLPGYHCGGTIHVVLNNQVGFTTNYMEGRSSTYCTDIAKVTLSPVFHVNADDVEAVVFAIQLAMEYRQTFRTDVYIDLLGYRRYGHNESDEPRFTQPKLYKTIAKHPDPCKIYAKKLLEEKTFSSEEIKNVEKDYRQMLQEKLDIVRREEGAKSTYTSFKGDWAGYRRPNSNDFHDSPQTGISLKDLRKMGTNILTIPEDFQVIPKIRRIYDTQKKLLLKEGKCDWAVAEYLAYASLLTQGFPVRLSGQDSKRGTFAHRHSVILREDTEEQYIPLNNVALDQATFYVYNSPLSEYGVMGFEFGYASANPKTLTIWEGQFGDFVNGAQIIIDQFLCCSETKWKRNNGLVLYLPHGYEGQGPEHSSARMERFLELCAYNNMQIVNCTTAANFFHVLRRHVLFPFRMPLVIFTPKSLLRGVTSQSPIEDLVTGKFQMVIDDQIEKPQKVKRVLLCNGKVAYDLLKHRNENKKEDVVVLRLEQLYPFPQETLQAIFDQYKNAKEFIWVQEEPENMGAWSYILRKWPYSSQIKLVSRHELSAPATGSNKQHKIEQQELVEKAFK
ncbi:2-oxoglutarate dehydrogenase E1 component [Candidatus Uabimicrobium sp. HlEnr_7]|uniref:2-oxoglutarate dehydrogenase E1 component n=1 Tax=Candidatus Uabimicrobium helgolandensis TaxID=3095367 RepID=UPI00355654EC